jgi:MFS family permease
MTAQPRETAAPARKGSGSALGWAVCGLGAIYFGYGYAVRVSPSAMIEPLMRDLSGTAAVLGTLAGIYFYVYAAMQLPLGLAIDRIGPRRILTAAALVCGAGVALFASADDLYTAYLGRALIGAGAAGAFASTVKLASLWLPPWRFALAVGLVNFIGMIGGALGQAPLALAVEAIGWRASMGWLAALAAVIALAIWMTRLAGAPPLARPVRVGGSAVLRVVLTRRSSWAVAAFAAASVAPVHAFSTLWGAPWGMAVYGVDPAAAAALASASLLGWGAGAPIVGWLSDRIGRRRPALLLAPVGALLTWPVLLYAPPPLWLAYPLLFLSGCCTAGALTAFAAAKEFTPPDAAATMTGLLNAAMMVSTALMQLFVGWLLDLQWDGRIENGFRIYDARAYILAFTSIPAGQLLAFVLVWFVPETFCRQSAEDAGAKA